MSYRLDPDTLELEEQAEGENFIIRHWRGHLSLPVSWFVVGVLLSTVLVAILATGVAAVEASVSSLRLIAVAWLAFFVLFVVLRVWATVGIWRSAGYHELRGGSAGWATVAKFLVVIGVIGSLGQAKNYGKQVAEYAQLAAGRDSLGAAPSVTVAETGQDLKVEGVLTLGTAARVMEVAAAMPGLRAIELDSRGGRIFEAMKLAQFVREKKLGTSVSRTCESACTLVLLAGTGRTAAPGARIGFHQPDFPGYSPEDRKIAIAANSRQYVEAGIEKGFVDRVMQTPPSSMWYPTRQELIQAGVIDGHEIVVSPGTSEDWLTKRLALEAAELNRQGPINLDEYTALTSARAKGHEVHLMHRIRKPIDATQMRAAKPEFAADVRATACGNGQIRDLIEAGATFTYRYEQIDGRPVFDISISSCG